MKKLLTALMALATFGAYALDLIPAQNEKGKWGYVDENGKKVISYKYDEAWPFEKGLAMVRKGDSYGMINENAKEVLPVKYDIIERHNSYIFRVAAGGKHKDGVLLDEKYGFVDDSGKELLKPEYDEIGNFADGLAYIKKGQLYGYVNDKIDIVIPCKYNAIGSFTKSGYVWACEGAKFENGSTSSFSGGKYGIFDREGKVIVPVKYKTAGSFIPFVYVPSKETLDKMQFISRTMEEEAGSHYLIRKQIMPHVVFSKLREDAQGFYASNNSDGSKNAVFDLNGRMIVKEGTYNHAFYPTDGMMPIVDKKGRYNFVNVSTGNFLLKQSVYNVWAFQDGVAIINREKDSAELINLEGDPISSTYKEIYPRTDGVYIVKSDADSEYIYYGVINAKGREIVPANYTFIFPPVNGLMASRPKRSNPDKLEPAGYLNTKGEWAIEPQFESIYSFKNDIALVKNADGWGFIDRDGNQVVTCQWASTKIPWPDKNGFHWVSDDESGKAGYMIFDMAQNKVVSTDKYPWNRNFGQDFEGVALAGLDSEHIGIVDTKGNVIIPTVFTFDEVTNAYRYLLDNNKTDWEEFDTYKAKLYSNPKRNKARLNQKIESSLWDY